VESSETAILRGASERAHIDEIVPLARDFLGRTLAR
jgi:hypothetical protein